MHTNKHEERDTHRVKVDTVRIIMDKYQFTPEFTSSPEQLLHSSNSIHDLKAKRLVANENN